MKHLILTVTLFTVGACGSSIDKLANSIDNASSTAKTIQCDQKSSAAGCPAPVSTSTQTSNPNDVNVASSTTTKVSAPAASSVTVSNSTTVVINAAQVQTSDADNLDNTSWVSACESGITYKASFAKGIEILTTNIYQDDACQVLQHSVDQFLTYAQAGDDIEFNEGAANVFVAGAPFQTISTDGNTLSFSGNEAQVYTRL